ncbi:RecQ family ATP-dependent DNA helicase [uncultured Lutibacter sp.]|uniref:RecQ family ATP-dependent DNA helicase n=1 Tax=uncultured Lutibacter sp. TaxID=437739 RepID=UPI0026339350|nr:RecQ family ATP-dependent DNA helicase [uncultured Lutibacter sp.]
MMRKYSANYSYTNHNFVIQNLNSSRKESEFLSAILIIKNLIQRGKPTLMSQYLQSIYGSIHKETEAFKKPFVLINQSNLKWINTIRGDEENNYFPARTFLEERITQDLSEYEFIKQLIVPEIEINQITQRDDENFRHQCVDFFLPQANLVIEIDGQQHKEEIGRVVDSIRDNHLSLSRVKTVRIDTLDLEARNETYFEKIEEIKGQLDTYSRFLNLYKNNFNLSFAEIPEEIKKTKLLPTATIRFQILILELLESGVLNLDDKKWIIEIKNRDVNSYENYAIEDIFEWFQHLLKLQKIEFKEPEFEIRNVENFSNENCIKVDFSLLERWTDENSLNESIIYVRTDYLDLFHNRNKNKLDRINYFKLSTSKKFKYKLLFNDESDDLENLEFFLKNIFEYNKFNNGQISIIQNILENNTTIGLLPTGGGKSLTYQLACLLQPCISFVVCPIKSLMYDQINDLDQAYIQNIESINSDTIGAERTEILDNYGNGKYFFVFISPERFQTKDFRERLTAINKQLNFSYAVIDEVHCLSEWGHDFRTSYLNLSNTIKKYCPEINFLGLTATASVNVLKDIQLEFNTDQKNVKTLTDYTRPELEFIVINDNGNKYKELNSVIDYQIEENNLFNTESDNTKCGLIFTPFVNGVNGCFDLSNNLSNKYQTPVKFYSGSKPRNYNNVLDFETYKVKVQDEYKQNKFTLLTATKAFGMGINKKNIGFTVHYGMPASMESLYQEAGRAGRDKSDSKCYVLLTEEDPETDVGTIFNPESTYEEIQSLTEQVRWDGKDVFRQIFLYQNGLDSISDELNLVSRLHNTYSESGVSRVVYARNLDSNKAKVEKAIYRLSNLGVIADWTVDDFFNGVFTVTYNNYTEESIKSTLLKFIKKYVDDFEFDNHSDRVKYSNILNDNELPTFKRYVKVLLQWSYDKFGTNRRESLKNVYENCLKYDDTLQGKEAFKKSLEAYFKFTEATYILQHIAENNNKDFTKWFEVFYDENNNFVRRDDLIDLKGNLQRFLESFQTNTGLNLINGLTNLLLENSFNAIEEQRFSKAFDTISNYEESKFDYIVDQILEISKNINQKGKIKLLKFLYKFSKSDEEKLRFAKELGDTKTILIHYNDRLKNINKNIENGFRKIG